MPSRTLMLATVGIVGISAEAPTVASAKDLGHLQGSWTAMRAEYDGREAPDIVGHLLVFEDGEFSIKEKGVTIYRGTFRLDTSASPSAIDFTHTAYSSKGKTWRGIYRIDGDTLTICDDAHAVQKGRPTRFDTKPNSGHVMVVFKRAQQ